MSCYGSNLTCLLARSIGTYLRSRASHSTNQHLRLQAITRRHLSLRRTKSLLNTAQQPPNPVPFPTYFQPASSPPPPRRLRRFLVSSGLILVFGTLGTATAFFPEVRALLEFSNPPTDAETLELFVPEPGTAAATIDAAILSHPIAQQLRKDPRYTESRPHMKVPRALRAANLTAGTLAGPGRFEVPPLVFQDKTSALPSLVSLTYMGNGLGNDPAVLHAGVLATVLDEGLARTCFPALPHKVGVTATLKVDYALPCPPQRIVIMRAETVRVEGRKAWVKGRLEVEDEVGSEKVAVVAEAEALFVEPRSAAKLSRIYSDS